MNRLKRIQFWGENKEDDRLVRQILIGEKTATVCPVETYFDSDGEFDDGGYEVDELVEVYDLNEKLRCTIQILDFYITPFSKIPDKLWMAEGNISAKEFRQAHRKAWAELELTNDFQLAVNHFRLVDTF